MIKLQAHSRYYSRQGLLNFLRSKFGDHLDFRINEVDDGYYTFEAPRDLTPVSILHVQGLERIDNSNQAEWR
jgi:hypothetical protein